MTRQPDIHKLMEAFISISDCVPFSAASAVDDGLMQRMIATMNELAYLIDYVEAKQN